MADAFPGFQADQNHDSSRRTASNASTNVTSGDWLAEILDEVGLSQFHDKLTNDLQLTRLSHFDFVGEDDLINIGMSRPAAKRLLASIRKKKSLVTAIKNKIVNKLLPITNATRKTSSPTLAAVNLSSSSSPQASSPLPSFSYISAYHNNNNSNNSSTRSRQAGLTCLINNSDVEIKEEIGHGVHGVVRRGLWTVSNCKRIEVALKILKNDLISSPSNPHTSFDEFIKEINIMHKLNHPNLIKLYGVVLSSPMMMVTELAPFGNLRDKLRKENGRTAISLLINFADQIAYGMGYLETKRLVHRDLATRNIFISHNERIKIGDFGLMRAIPQHMEHYVMNETTRIPFPWCAPESLKLKLFSSASDTYMYAVTIWEMLSFGKEPWAALSGSEILAKLDKGERLVQPPACSPSIYQTLLQCWDSEPSNRPTFSALSNFMSTSYPLEVKATKSLSQENSDQYYPPLNSSKRAEDDLVSVSSKKLQEDKREILNCEIDDRIQVIDGQPENYWWKGQNQRTFNVGWFPLNITQWLGPKKQSYISKPIKNSFIHTGHLGPDGRWGDPKSIDPMYLKNPLAPIHHITENDDQLSGVKLKTRSKLSRLFGINEPSSNNSNQHLSENQKSYHKLLNDGSMRPSSRKKLFNNMQRSQSQDIPTKEKSNDTFLHSKKTRDEPPLIDFSDELQIITTNSFSRPDGVSTATSGPSLANHIKSSKSHESLYRPLSDTNLQVFGDRYHDISQAGSWNTGTFDDAYGSSNNNYSKYYCPQDAVVNNSDPEAYHYYSAVPYAASGANPDTNDSSIPVSGPVPTDSVKLNRDSDVTGNCTDYNSKPCLPNSVNTETSQKFSSSHHIFPVTFDDASSLNTSSSIESGKANETKHNNFEIYDSRKSGQSSISKQQYVSTNCYISGTQHQAANSTATNNCTTIMPTKTITTETLHTANTSMNACMQQTIGNSIENTPNSAHHSSPVKLSKEFIKTLEDELGISPGSCSQGKPGGNIGGTRTKRVQNNSSLNTSSIPLPLPPPPVSLLHPRQSSAKTLAQVAIVAPNCMLTSNKSSKEANKGYVMNGTPSSREQRLVNQIQKRCSGDIDAIKCLQALRRNNLNYELAIHEIQVDRLMSLQITKDKNRCERALIATNWKLESAASRLLDETL